MKFTPSALWSLIAGSPYRILTWQVLVRLVSDLAEPLDSGTAWTDVTSTIREIPVQKSAAEFQIGTFMADSIKLTADDIGWWQTNVFGAAATSGDYVELKIQLTMALTNGAGASDVCITFSGLVETSGQNAPQSTETADEIEFSIMTYDENAQRIPAMSINYPAPAAQHLYLDALKVEIVDTNIAGYPLAKGTHELEYDYTGANPMVSLDHGQPREIVVGATLEAVGNGLIPVPDTQQCSLLFDDLPADKSASVKFYLDAPGGTAHALQDTISVKTLLSRAYAAEGIADVTFDDLTLTAWDDSERLSFLGRPPDDVTSETLPCKTIAAGTGSILYIGVGPYVYEYDVTAKTYTLLLTMPTNVIRIIFNARNNHLWVLTALDTGKTYASSYRVYDLTSSSWLTGTPISLRGACAAPACDVMDYLYDGTNYHYRLLVADVTGWLDEYDTAGTRAQIGADGAYAGYAWKGLFDSLGTYNIGDIVEYRGFPWICLADATTAVLPPASAINNSNWIVSNGNQSGAVSLLASFDGSTGTLYHSVTRDSGAHPYIAIHTFQPDGTWSSITAWSASFCDDPTKVLPGRIAIDYEDANAYWWDRGQTNIYHQGQADVGRNLVVTQNYLALPAVDGCSGMQAFNGMVYGSFHMNGAWMLCKVGPLGGPPAANPIDVTSGFQLGASGSALTISGTVVYGLDTAGRLIKLDTAIEMCHIGIDYSTMSVHDVINKSLSAYMLLGKISSTKKAAVYKRIDASGDLVTSGSAISVTVSNDADIVRVQEYLQACKFVSVTGQGGLKHTYNGMAWDDDPQPGDVVLNLSSDWLPAALVQDVAFWLWKFASTGHDIFTLPILSANTEAEVFDGADVDFTTTKIQKQAIGVIMELSVKSDASLEAKVLF